MIKEIVKEQSFQSNVLSKLQEFDHEQVVFCHDKEANLRAIIAIHDTTLGPALGGLRMWNYSCESEALQDVLRLSRGMTYKSAIAGLNLGGGKAVIIGDSYTQKSELLFRRFGKFVDSLGGKYITAEDVGINPSDMEFVNMETSYVTGLPGKSGDPSPITAYGVYMGIKASVKQVWGTDNLDGKKILIQGVGHVGKCLVEYCVKENAKVFINDINEKRLKRVAEKFNVKIVLGDDIYGLDIDVYSPCALGGTINNRTIEKFRCAVVAGGANNQLLNEKIHGSAIMEKGILFAPDFVINAGGIINVNSEIAGYDHKKALQMTEKIYQTTLNIFKESKEYNIPTYLAANNLAEKRIKAISLL